MPMTPYWTAIYAFLPIRDQSENGEWRVRINPLKQRTEFDPACEFRAQARVRRKTGEPYFTWGHRLRTWTLRRSANLNSEFTSPISSRQKSRYSSRLRNADDSAGAQKFMRFPWPLLKLVDWEQELYIRLTFATGNRHWSYRRMVVETDR
jgi:hypothetical protein